ncbi:MAG: decaprenyl-phosphate phosphoribosyltransferase [Clostridia bacterium]|nr:decaprenyl-phosphate phosphoribosyltransferase [Clostridia bacterium]
MRKYLRLARVYQYPKNVFVLFPIFFSGFLTDWSKVIKIIWGFLCFCFLSSVVYILNDIKDAESDRNHPVKKNRPIANGSVSTAKAYILAGILLFFSILIELIFFSDNLLTLVFTGTYLLLNILYSVKLKNIPIIDILILASGFVIRVLFGAAIIGVEVSTWLYLTVLSISLFLALGKRRNEYKNSTSLGSTRKCLKKYSYEYLDKMMYMFAALAIVFYSLWCINNTIIIQNISTEMMWSIPFVIAIVMRYCFDIESDSHGDPTDVIINDKVLLGICASFVIYITSVMYIL